MLGSDLNINGDIGEAGVDGPPGTEPVSSAEPQTSPPEGNSMLGKKHFQFTHVAAPLIIQFIPKSKHKGQNLLKNTMIHFLFSLTY